MRKNFRDHYHLIISLRSFISEMSRLIISPIFIFLTILGNLFILSISGLFYLIEFENNPKLHGILDAIWWGFATATTTGYGDITPVTSLGKTLGIFLMLSGTAIFAMFTALFAETILNSARDKK